MSVRLPVLDQRDWDLIGLGLVVAGVFFAFVFYLGWNGGEVGESLESAFVWTLGRVAYAIPFALLVAGALVVLRPMLPATRPFRAAGLCLLAAATLALAAGTFGLGDSAPRAEFWDPATFEARGGIVGEALYWASSRLFQDFGADLLAVFLLVAGVLLLTGASVAGLLRSTGNAAAGTTRRLRRGEAPGSDPAGIVAIEDDADALALFVADGVPAPEVHVEAQDARGAEVAALEAGDAEAAAGPPGGAIAVEPAEDAPLHPPEPPAQDLVVRATHVEAPPIDPAERFPDLFGRPGTPPEPNPADAPAARRPPPAPERDEPAPEDEEAPEPVTEPGTTAAEPPPAGDADATLPLPKRPGHDASDLTPQGRLRASVTDDPGFAWRIPDPLLLERSSAEDGRPDTAGQQQIADTLVEALGHFGVKARVIGMVAGPHITRFELRLAPGTKVARVAQLKDDLAYALAASEIRILAPIPGKQAVGVEVPNKHRRMVHLGDVFQDPPRDWSPLSVWLGKDVAGRAIGADLAKMPHLLVAGTTGAGKSGCVNAMLSSILLRATPHDVRMVLVDPKQVELNHYDSLPHLLTPVITSPRQAANALANLVREMERRYGMMSLARTRNLPELNLGRAKRGEPPLPYVLCVIDELADLMMVAPADVEDAIIRLAQKARAVGIHLVLATQSPRVDVITGMIKANVPSRIAFAVSSQTDSRVILDQNGAEGLLGQGDMLFSPIGSSKLQRIQGAYIDERQIALIADWWRRQGEPDFEESLLEEVEDESADGGDDGALDPDEDPLLSDAIQLVVDMGTASTSMLQRRLRLGYTRAGRLVDMLERRGVISGYEGSKPRQVLVSAADLPRMLATVRGDDGNGSALDDAEHPDDPVDAPES